MAVRKEVSETVQLFMSSMRQVVKAAPDDDKELLTELFLKAASNAKSYVAIVAEAELERRVPTQGREEAADLDRRRSIIHDAFISSVDACNRACEKEGAPLIYTGGKERREYGDFAILLVDGLFGERI